MSALRLELETETWGDRLRRARERSNVPLRDAAALISQWEQASRQRLLNLEALREPPADAGRRILAVLTAVAYGYDPAALGLDWDDLPRRIARDQVISTLSTSSRCIGPWAGQEAWTWEPTGLSLALAA